MKLHKLHIEGFRKIKDADIVFGDATFLIGENNVGKSTVLTALSILLSDKSSLDENDFSKEMNNGIVVSADKIVLTAEFRNVPLEIIEERGFNRKRLSSYDTSDTNDTGLGFTYRKTFMKNEKVCVEMLLAKQKLKQQFENCKTPKDFVDAGASEEIMRNLFAEFERKISDKNREKLCDISELWDIDLDDKEWVINPGGIPGNVLSKLPRFLLIPAEDKTSEISDNSGAMVYILKSLFDDVKENSQYFKEAQKYLTLLSEELDSSNSEKEFGIMMKELNDVLDDIFPSAKINAIAKLNELKPTFDVTMTSNVSTPVNYQGTGMVRAAVFALLRYRKHWEEKKNNGFKRGLIIGFEEPELYLHPNAANKMRNTIYDLANGNSQIVCTTHSPYMIDLSKKPKQVLNSFKYVGSFSNVNPFNISDEFIRLSEDDKTYIKLIQKIDDYIARVFFAKHIIIVEGDTEDIVLKRTIELMPDDIKSKISSDYQIVKAIGKPVIISLVKYLKAMGILPFVIHDRDNGTDGATIFNSHILNALDGNEESRIMMKECIEEELGYPPPSHDKPYKAYQFTDQWNDWSDVPDRWKLLMKKVFRGYL